MNSISLGPLCTRVTFLSGKSTAISPASSTPEGPPPTIRMEFAAFIFSHSDSQRNFMTHVLIRSPLVKYSLWLIRDLSAKDGSTIALMHAHAISKYSFLNSKVLNQLTENDNHVQGNFTKRYAATLIDMRMCTIFVAARSRSQELRRQKKNFSSHLFAQPSTVAQMQGSGANPGAMRSQDSLVGSDNYGSTGYSSNYDWFLTSDDSCFTSNKDDESCSELQQIPPSILSGNRSNLKGFNVNGWSPICFLVLPTNKSPDLIRPGNLPLTVANGNCATASFLPNETIATAEPAFIVSLSHAVPSGFAVHRKWQSASMLSPTEVWNVLPPSEMEFKSTLCSSFTSTFFDSNHFRVLSEAFGPTNSISLGPLCTRVTFFSGKSTAISPASSTPVGPPPTIRTEFAAFIFSQSDTHKLHPLRRVVGRVGSACPVAITR
ncbi:hypothetical protein G2W53_021337 [Senna tora]|uniref:Uncharacterized protein n=1 Tax=Senna tora TaxID=362788 RepID=A0A834TJD6_9FABA|nr:hypothetical protein G2W53_021337 [Senna tora]